MTQSMLPLSNDFFTNYWQYANHLFFVIRSMLALIFIQKSSSLHLQYVSHWVQYISRVLRDENDLISNSVFKVIKRIKIDYKL